MYVYVNLSLMKRVFRKVGNTLQEIGTDRVHTNSSPTSLIGTNNDVKCSGIFKLTPIPKFETFGNYWRRITKLTPRFRSRNFVTF